MVSGLFFGAAFLMWILAHLYHYGLVVTIRDHYPDYYEVIGKPNTILHSFARGWSFVWYVLLGRFNSDRTPEEILGELRISRFMFLSAITFLVISIAASAFD